MAEAQPKDRRRIYVSSDPRDDTVAVRLIEDLRREFGADRVVTASTSTTASPDDLKHEFELLLDSCSVVLIVVGEGWLSNRRREPEPGGFDLTAFEAARALDDHEIVVIPVLVGASVLPPATDLPIRLAALSTCEAVTLNGQDRAVRLAELSARIAEAFERASAREVALARAREERQRRERERERLERAAEARAREMAAARERRADEARARTRFDAPPDASIPVFDENVQFSVFRPSSMQPQRWYPLLVFAHLSARRPDAGVDEPDPLADVQARAERALGDAVDDFRSVTQDSMHAVMREGELRLVPRMKGVEFNPPERRFLWIESVHQEDFRIRAQGSMDGQVARGSITVYSGNLLLANVPLTITIDRRVSTAPQAQSEARPYRRIFASYSHLDQPIVEEFERHARATGDTYLRDVISLRAGEVWRDRLADMIRQADVFQLFWSWNALASPFVRAEWQHALALNRPHFVRPVYWEEPLPERADLPPAELKRLHFERVYPRFTVVEEAAVPRTAGGAQGPAVLVPGAPPPVEATRRSPAPERSHSTVRLIRRGSLAAAAVLAVGLSVAIFGTWSGGESEETTPSESPPVAGSTPPPDTSPSTSAPVPAPSPIPAPPTIPAPPPAAGVVVAPGASVQRQVEQVLRAYEAAWARQDLDGLRRVWAMPDAEAREIGRTFRELRSVEVRLRILRVSAASDSRVSAHVVESRSVRARESDRIDRSQRERVFHLEKRAGSWMIVSIAG
jgi:hypothetical protein